MFLLSARKPLLFLGNRIKCCEMKLATSSMANNKNAEDEITMSVRGNRSFRLRYILFLFLSANVLNADSK